MPAKPARDTDATSPFTLSLRIKHPSIDPQEITDELQLTPEHSWACGEPRTSESGAALGGTRRNSYWSAVLPPLSQGELLSAVMESFAKSEAAAKPASIKALAEHGVGAFPKMPASVVPGALSQHLFVQLVRLKRRRPFFERLEQEGAEISLAVEIDVGEASSFTLSPAIARLIGELGVQIDFELG